MRVYIKRDKSPGREGTTMPRASRRIQPLLRITVIGGNVVPIQRYRWDDTQRYPGAVFRPDRDDSVGLSLVDFV